MPLGRDGRILRQGNQNPTIEIVRYVTERVQEIMGHAHLETTERQSGPASMS